MMSTETSDGVSEAELRDVEPRSPIYTPNLKGTAPGGKTVTRKERVIIALAVSVGWR